MYQLKKKHSSFVSHESAVQAIALMLHHIPYAMCVTYGLTIGISLLFHFLLF
jgi:hypothetical protein